MSAKENLKTALVEIFLTKPATEIGKPGRHESDATVSYDLFDADTSVLSARSRVDGNIYSENHIRINGTVTGNVVAKGNIYAKGKINGDISCHSICLSSCEIFGNISAVSDVKVEIGSVIHGDVAAKNLFSSGEINGNLFIGGHVHFSGMSLNFGSLRAKTVTMEDGAVFSGQAYTSNALSECSV
jgi:cytoskeletal protein CcmA (bactofilin family)